MARETKERDQTPLRAGEGGKSRLRRAYEKYRAAGIDAAGARVTTELSRDDEEYAASVARLAGRD